MIKIRKIKRKDLSQLNELLSQLAGDIADLEKMKKIFKKIDKNKNYYLFGAFENDLLVGSIMGVLCYDMVMNCKPFMVMENMIVKKEKKRLGIGRLLLEKLEKIAYKNKCIFIQFCSSSFRKEAHRFYESMGYHPDEVKEYRKFMDMNDKPKPND